jgi:hypothetical protein
VTKISELPLTSYTSTGDDHIIVNHTENSYVNTCQTALSEWISDYISNSTLVTTYSEYHTILLAIDEYRDHGPSPQRIALDDLMSNYLSGYLSTHIGDYISSIADAFNSNYPLSGLDGYISQYLDDHGGGGGGGGDVSEAIESYFSEYPQYTVNDYLGSWVEDSPYQLSDFISDYLSDNLSYFVDPLISENISNNMSIYLSEVLVSDAYLSEIYSVIYNYPNESLDNYLSQYLNDHLSEFLP